VRESHFETAFHGKAGRKGGAVGAETGRGAAAKARGVLRAFRRAAMRRRRFRENSQFRARDVRDRCCGQTGQDRSYPYPPPSKPREFRAGCPGAVLRSPPPTKTDQSFGGGPTSAMARRGDSHGGALERTRLLHIVQLRECVFNAD
jgi:hypothetical protein